MSEKKKLILFYKDNQPISELVTQLKESRDKYSADVDFFKKKAQQAEKKFKAETKELWDKIEKQIDAQGILQGEKAKDVNMEIDRDLECIVRHTCSEHPLASLFGGLLK